jgi:hypothetical protein
MTQDAGTDLLALFLGWLGGIATTFVEPLREWVYRAKLRLEFGDSLDFQTITPEFDLNGRGHRALYLRVRVVNTSARLARSCRAYLVGVEELKGTYFSPTIYCDHLQLGWSALDSRTFDAIDLPQGVSQFIDVISTRETSPSLSLHTAVHPVRYSFLFANTTTYRLTIQVSGDWVQPETIRILVKLGGRWDSLLAWPAPADGGFLPPPATERHLALQQQGDGT